MTVPFLFYLSRHAPKKYLRAGMLAAAVLTAFAALGTQSRGALLGIGAMTVFLWLKSRSKILTGVLIALFAAIVLPMLPEEWYARMSTIQTYEQDASAQGRLNAWGMAFNMALHRLTGGGFESFQQLHVLAIRARPQQRARFPQHLLSGDGASWIHRFRVIPPAHSIHVVYRVVGHQGREAAMRA